MENYKECPICGTNKNVVFYRNGLKYDHFYDFGICCNFCDVSIEGNIENDVIEKWNRLTVYKKYYYDLADAIARESSSCEELCSIARQTRKDLNSTTDEYNKLRKVLIEALNHLDAYAEEPHDLLITVNRILTKGLD